MFTFRKSRTANLTQRRTYGRRRLLALEHLEDRSVPSSYMLTDLGTLGGASAAALDINDAGQIVGYAATPTSSQGHAFLWQNGVMTDLGTVGGNVSWANALNSVGQVAGQSTVATGSSATGGFFWNGGAMTGFGVNRSAYGINDAGQVVGVDASNSSYRAFVWDDGVFTDLGTIDFGGGGTSIAYDINNAGQIVGASAANGFGLNQPPLPPRAVLWQKGEMINLGLLPGDTESSASAINSLGQIVGTSEFMDPNTYEITSQSFIWQDGTMTNLNVPSSESRAADINDAGQVVGSMKIGFGNSTRAYIYDDGVVTNLNNLVPAGSGLTITGAWGINNAGQIAASAVDSAGRSHAVLLNPAPDTPAITISDVSATEGNIGTQSAVFTVSLSAASTQTVTVQFLTANGTAGSGTDYNSAGGAVTFAPGQTSQTISVPVIGDRSVEPYETFVVNLNNAANAIVGDSQGIGTILDDEPRIWINNVALTEGNSGNKIFTFTVTLGVAYDQAVTMSYRTANGSAIANGGQADYMTQSGTLSFSAGETTKTISIAVKGDRRSEANETFFVDLLGNSSHSLITSGRGIGTILNDD